MAESAESWRCARRGENFPVASFLLAPKARAVVLAFYAFAREADDVADNADLTEHEKLARLDAFEAALIGAGEGPGSASALRSRLGEAGLGPVRGLALLEAFRRDAMNEGCADWSGLLDYCAWSANPVGRFLLELHGERPGSSPEAFEASDALCTALQVLNHVQDAGRDYAALRRVYLPEDWMSDAGVAPDHLEKTAATPGVRAVFDRLLDECDALIAKAAALPRALRSRRLAAESGVIIGLARRLARRLRSADPLAVRVAPTKGDLIAATLIDGAAAVLLPPKPASFQVWTAP